MIHVYDTEFLDDGRSLSLISIGIAAEDGREYHAVLADAPWERVVAHDWLRENVVPLLPGGMDPETGRWSLDAGDPRVRSRSRIAREVEEFLLSQGEPELWADYGAYDHVALCGLYGAMVDLPRGIPMFTRELRQEAASRGLEVPEMTAGAHDALEDARHVLRVLRAWGVASGEGTRTPPGA
ncbi:3'-5' exoribonuclease domain-containing protein [Nocardiopsis alba]|uniref:3'-5' exoribonuclease domain-containing protein n=1 Tax=Nocardiopsis alba TaxID=53437 RepID=UPI0035E039F8